MKNNSQPYVCSNCIGSEEYKTFIKEEGIGRKTCAYCKKQRTCVYLDLLADKIDEEYRANYVPNHSDDDYGEPPYEIISQILELDGLEKLANDLVCILSESESRDVSQGADSLYDRSSLYKRTEKYDCGNILEHIETWEYFCWKIKHETRFFNNKLIQSLNSLFSELDTFSYDNNKPIRTIKPNAKDAIFYRARYAADSSEKIRSNPGIELGPPPPSVASSGRMNPVGVSVFYGAFEQKTCIAEIRVPVGETAISGQFKLEKPITVLDLTVFDTIEKPRNAQFTDSNQLGLFHFLRDFSLEISKPVHLDNANLEYLPTQALSEYLAYHYQPKIDAIIYPSTQTNGEGKNIVILNHAAKLNYENSKDNYFSYVPDSLKKHKIKAIKYDVEDDDFLSSFLSSTKH